MIVLDTNVLSELMRSQPNEYVLQWIAKHTATTLFITVLTQAEILYGLELLPEGKRRNALLEAAQSMFDLDFAGRILPFDCAAAQQFAAIAAKRRTIGRPISQIDAQIAAIALSHNATLATRNISDFEECGIIIINPWAEES
ncbi:MAG: type II toxin-antitoxin system VapC family toxin [Xenococcaceae cyanobacterium]